jgi:hypothetical protein
MYVVLYQCDGFGERFSCGDLAVAEAAAADIAAEGMDAAIALILRTEYAAGESARGCRPEMRSIAEIE